MPFIIHKLSNGKYMVMNGLTGHIFSKGTTLARAKSQVKYLHTVDIIQRMNMNADWERNYRKN